ncbi:MAG: hypothetical protein M3Y87_18765 [Myxococcota bacterium]|nr:hypothetical protein [Myxococcota bacterium]
MTTDAAPPNRFKNVLIVLAVLGVLGLLGCVACGIGGYFWAQQTAGEMRVSGVRIQAEAEAFAAGHTQSECVDESLLRSDACGEEMAIMCHAEAGVFLRRCAERATPTPGFCDGVPRADEIMQGATWSVAYCTQLGRRDDPRCPQLVRGVVELCAGR